MDLKQKKVLVVGTGVSGIAAAELLKANGIAFEVYDGNGKLSEADVRAKSEAFSGCTVMTGTLPENAPAIPTRC